MVDGQTYMVSQKRFHGMEKAFANNFFVCLLACDVFFGCVILLLRSNPKGIALVAMPSIDMQRRCSGCPLVRVALAG